MTWWFAALLAAVTVATWLHEIGHLFAAWMLGIRVEAFSVGSGPMLFRRQRRGTRFDVHLLPWNGFVDCHDKAALWKFMVVCLAGPMANFSLAAVCALALAVKGETMGVRMMLNVNAFMGLLNLIPTPGSDSAQAGELLWLWIFPPGEEAE